MEYEKYYAPDSALVAWANFAVQFTDKESDNLKQISQASSSDLRIVISTAICCVKHCNINVRYDREHSRRIQADATSTAQRCGSTEINAKYSALMILASDEPTRSDV